MGVKVSDLNVVESLDDSDGFSMVADLCIDGKRMTKSLDSDTFMKFVRNYFKDGEIKYEDNGVIIHDGVVNVQSSYRRT